MRLELRGFQRDAVSLLLSTLQGVWAFHATSGTPQAVVFSAPTGSGKTVMATAMLEALLFGNAEFDQAPDPHATFLWITDQPQLNLQTMRKIIQGSSQIQARRLVELEDKTFQDRVLDAGKIYFLNTQRLSAASNLLKPHDYRSYTFWDTYSETVANSDRRLVVIVDEAHRGVGGAGEEDALTIMRRFLLGFSYEGRDIPPAPVALGITATPARFEKLVESAEHGKQPVRVEPIEVRESGLIKDQLTVVISESDKPADFALLRSAARRFREVCASWDAYHAQFGGDEVLPVFVVQVADKSDNHASATDLNAAIAVIREEVGDIVASDRAFAHVFGEPTGPLELDRATLRRVEAADIDGNEDVRVVFFKTTLNQGWDCPRAEVMMSFRRVDDATLIAQLIGRMIRTPLARKILEKDELNRVDLFLPHFTEATVEKILAELEGLPIEKETGKAPPVILIRRPGSENLFAALEEVPSYVVPRPRKTKYTRLALKCAALVDEYGLGKEELDTVEEQLVMVLLAESATRENDPAFQAQVAERGVIAVLTKAFDPYGGELGVPDARSEIDASAENADYLFAYSGRLFGAGLHRIFWRRRIAADGRDVAVKAKLESAVLASMPEILETLESRARETLDDLRQRFGAAVDHLDSKAAARFKEVWELFNSPTPTRLKLPETMAVPAGGNPAPGKHLYVRAPKDLSAPIRLGAWERSTVEAETSRRRHCGWWRNPDRRAYSLTVPYEDQTLERLFPDILALRKEADTICVDLLDPHNPDLPDAIHKAHGLAKYARNHAHSFGRIELIMMDGGQLKRIDLTKSAARKAVLSAGSNDALKQLFS